MRQCYDRVFNWISISNEKKGELLTDIRKFTYRNTVTIRHSYLLEQLLNTGTYSTVLLQSDRTIVICML